MTTSTLTATLRRWLTENVADTRTSGPPGGRTYAAPFAEVWDAVRGRVDAHPRWRVEHADETNGILRVTCRSRVFRFVDDLTVWISLDEEGLTRLEARSAARTGKGDFGVNRRRIESLLADLDARFDRVGDARPSSP